LISPSLSNAQSISKVQTKLVASLHFVKMAMNILKSCRKFEVSNRFQNAPEFKNLKQKQNLGKEKKKTLPLYLGQQLNSLPSLPSHTQPRPQPSSGPAQPTSAQQFLQGGNGKNAIVPAKPSCCLVARRPPDAVAAWRSPPPPPAAYKDPCRRPATLANPTFPSHALPTRG
jgi:hypothetical protein